MKPTKELVEHIKPGDIIWVNNWKSPFCVKCVSKNYFIATSEDDGERIYTICSKNPFNGQGHSSVKSGDFYCGPANCSIEKFFWQKRKNLYDFSDKNLNRKYLDALENGKNKILEHKMATIDEIVVFPTQYYKEHPSKFLEDFLNVKLSTWQKLLVFPKLFEKHSRR